MKSEGGGVGLDWIEKGGRRRSITKFEGAKGGGIWREGGGIW